MTRRAAIAYESRLAAARFVLVWESLWPRLLPLLGLAGIFVVLAFLRAFAAVPAGVHAAILAVFALAATAAAIHAAGGLAPVGRAAARRRVELDSGLVHRPLTAVEDVLAGGQGDRRSAALWQVHRARAAAAAGNLKLAPPRPVLAHLDRFALRALLVLALVVAATVARHDPVERLRAALTPRFAVAVTEGPTVDAWITPPEYTRRPPLRLADATFEKPIPVPAGSTALVRVTGLDRPPALRLGAAPPAFESLGGGVHRVETAIHDGERLAVVANGGDEIASWPIDVVVDRAPEVAFTQTPSAGEHGRLRLAFRAVDDYGVTAVGATVTLDRTAIAEGTLVADAPDIALDLPVPRSGVGRSSHDLTAHMWAGLPVRARLKAADAAGQEATSREAVFVLPEREFKHPVARAIIGERRQLVDGTRTIRAAVAAGIAAIANQPMTFGGDPVVFLALSVAHSRLIRDVREAAIVAVRQLMWDAALRLEDGGTSIARRDLDRLRDELSQALRDADTPEEVERIMREIREALDRYLSALMRDAMERGMVREPMPGEQTVGRDELQRMLDEIRERAMLGDREGARQRLAELQRMLEQMRQMVERGKSSSEQAQKAKKLMDAMRELTRRQQELLDRSFGRSRQQSPAERERAAEDAMRDAPGQEALRRALGEMMLDLDSMLGQIPAPMGDAERAMRGAVEDLLLGDNPGAAEAQGQALDALRRATRDAAQQAAEQMGAGVTVGPGTPMPGQMPGRNRGWDPFGRAFSAEPGTRTDARDVDIPDAARVRRAQEILRELQRRAGESGRPQPERDYIERLLERFRPGP